MNRNKNDPPIVIDPDLKALIPPLSSEQREVLRSSIIEEGVRDPIKVWPTSEDSEYGKAWVIVDGHNRYEIATEEGIEESAPFRTYPFRDKSEAMVWMIDNQRGRRNLTPGAWAELGLKRSSLLEGRAKENQGKRNDISPTLDKSSDFQPVDTLAEAAKYSGLSRATMAKAKKVYESDNDEIKEKVRTGETSINRAYQEIKQPSPEPGEGFPGPQHQTEGWTPEEPDTPEDALPSNRDQSIHYLREALNHPKATRHGRNINTVLEQLLKAVVLKKPRKTDPQWENQREETLNRIADALILLLGENDLKAAADYFRETLLQESREADSGPTIIRFGATVANSDDSGYRLPTPPKFDRYPPKSK